MRIRNSVSRTLVVFAAWISVLTCASAQVKMDAPLHLAKIEGYVANIAGKPVVNAEVTLDEDGKVMASTHTDGRGAFRFDRVLGRYWLRVARTENAPAAHEIEVGDLIESYVERKKLYILVGPGACADACSSIFTSKHDFEKAIKNKNRH
ncbi:MAG TPA: carboxypeptidase-like regulatory domain-containing protein [Terracidiphilus sp.]|jgi:hypothetical protein